MLFLNDHIADLSDEQTERLIQSLPQWRREEALRYKHQQGRRECAVGYVELLRGLRECFGIKEMPRFAYNEHGKPFIKEHPEVHFSISHCRVAAGCLVSNKPCGFDVEYIRKAKPDLVRHTMNPEEQETIFAASFPDIAFTRLWTQKEVLLKLKGTGLIDNLHDVLSEEALQYISLRTTENLYLGYIYTTAIQL
ncbi:MAG: 4'-phosphopantetheinyl transferase superfamily protein [Bacteroidaceae bacterium]|nr:4'-phosphopantetheinyl transferase superfamily protein [Bacteroidaceae bacterium]